MSTLRLLRPLFSAVASALICTVVQTPAIVRALPPTPTSAKEAFFQAVIFGQSKKAIELASKLDVKEAEKGGATLLHIAASVVDIEVADYLLKQGAAINQKTDDGITPLHAAVDQIVLMLPVGLVENNLDSKAASGATRGERIELATEEVEARQVKFIEFLLKHGANPDVVDNQGVTPLMLAIKNRFPAAAQLLVGRSSTLANVDFSGETALSYAVRNGNVEMIEKLLSAGADINAADSSGNTPLHAAVESQSVAGVNTLLKHGADKSRKNEARYTPLEAAKRFKETLGEDTEGDIEMNRINAFMAPHLNEIIRLLSSAK